MFGRKSSQEEIDKIEEICKKLSNNLDDVHDWAVSRNNNYAEHKRLNVSLRPHYIYDPINVKVPRSWKKVFKVKIKKIEQHCVNESLDFFIDVLDGRYPLQIKNPGFDQRQWLKENDESENGENGEKGYVVKNEWYYIKDPALAVAYKLKWS